MLMTQYRTSVQVRVGQLNKHFTSCLPRPMAVRNMRLTVASTLVLVATFQHQPQLPNARTGETRRDHLSHRVPRERYLEVRRAPWAWNADNALAMRRPSSGGPPVTTLSPNTVRSPSASSVRPATEILGALKGQQMHLGCQAPCPSNEPTCCPRSGKSCWIG